MAIAVRLFEFSLAAAIVPAVIVFLGTYFLLARRSFRQLQAVTTKVQAELEGMPSKKKEQEARLDRAIRRLEDALPLGNWQFLLRSEIYGQIGMLKYVFKDTAGAEKAFARASSRNYFASAMKGAILFQRKDFVGMEKAFESAVSSGKKEGLTWAAYAWCLLHAKESDKAVAVLSRACKANPSDDKLKRALSQVQNDKRLKMAPWEPAWWQLGLELPPAPQAQTHMGSRRRLIRGR